jgi:hypothetical protein
MGWTPIQLTEDVGQQMRENAFASVGAVAGEDDLVVGVRLGHRLNEFEGQLGSSVVVGIGLGGFAATLLSLRECLSVAVEPHGDRQAKDFRGCPEKPDDDQAEHNPIVSPISQRLGATGDRRIIGKRPAKLYPARGGQAGT